MSSSNEREKGKLRAYTPQVSLGIEPRLQERFPVERDSESCVLTVIRRNRCLALWRGTFVAEGSRGRRNVGKSGVRVLEEWTVAPHIGVERVRTCP